MTQRRSDTHLGHVPKPGPAWVAEAIQVIERQPEDVEYHSNEFFKIELPATAGHARRVHVWLKSVHEGSEPANVHGHCWPFTSFILGGCVVEELFETELGDAFEEYAFRSGDEALEHRGKSGLHLREEIRHERGSMYSRAGDVLHRAHPIAIPTVTAVVHPLHRTQVAQVFVQANLQRGPGVPREGSKDELEAIRGTLREVGSTWTVDQL